MKYKTYQVQGQRAFAKGKKFNMPKATTLEKLQNLGVREIVWKNGDFIRLGR